MDANEQIEIFREFFELNYIKDIMEASKKENKYLSIDFNELSKFNPEISELLLDDPENIIRASEIAIESIDTGEDNTKINIRFKNLPSTQKIDIRDIRSKHLLKFIEVRGIVRQKSDVRPQVTMAKFECPACGNVIPMLQLEQKFKEPSKCSCGRKGKFKLFSKEMVDAQKIVLEEAPDELMGGEQPKRIDIFLKDDLVSPMSEKKTNPGSKIIITGVLKDIPVSSRDGGKLTRFDLLIEGNHIEPVEEDFSDIQINDEDKAKIIELSKKPEIYEMMIGSVAPSIYGYDLVKQALIFQLLGGTKKTRDDGISTRGDTHILLIGDPGSGKSQLLSRTAVISPKSRMVSGKGASGAGLTASVVKDEFMGGWALEAGAMVLANKGILMVDEMDKMTKEDRSAFHEALEQQTVTIAKANIQATLKCETTVLAAANPKYGRFDPYETISKQIDLPPSLISRFDLIFPIRDLPNKDKDGNLANFILKLHKNIDLLKGKEAIEIDTIKKYIAYARQNIRPILTDEAINEIQNFYVRMRNTEQDGEVQTISITPRQLEALIRLSEASAKVRLSKKVTVFDAKKAIELVHHCLMQIGLDPETGKIDIDRMGSGTTASERGNMNSVKNFINELSEVSSNGMVIIEELIEKCKEKGIVREKVEEILEKLKRNGDVYEPKPGHIQKM